LSEAELAVDAAYPLALPAGVSAAAFISDLHLSPDLPHTTAAFESLLQGDGALLPTGVPLFILGDLFEAWVGDDALAQPYEARCAQALAQAARERPLYVMRGNRDFLLGPRFFAETGCHELPDRVALQAFGQTALLCHGDELCLADVDYQRFRAMVRQPAWQAQMLARPWAERQAIAQQMRAASRAQPQGEVPSYADADTPLALRWMDACGAATLVHGHTHRPGSNLLAPGHQRHVLSDWDLDGAEAGPARAEVMMWSAAGWQRHALTPVPN